MVTGYSTVVQVAEQLNQVMALSFFMQSQYIVGQDIESTCYTDAPLSVYSLA